MSATTRPAADVPTPPRRRPGARRAPAAPPAPEAAGSALRPVGPHLVIAPAGDDRALGDALAAVRPEPGSLLVLAAAPDAAPVLRRDLPELARLAAERGAHTLVLAASGLAAPTPDGRRPVEQVARAAGLPVLAPDGLVSVEPDGTLLVTSLTSPEPGTWWHTPPSGPASPYGSTWPRQDGDAAPAPEAAGPDAADTPPPSGTRPAEPASPSLPSPAAAAPPPPVLGESPAAADLSAVLSPRTETPPAALVAARVLPLPAGHWLTAADAPAEPPAAALGFAMPERGTRLLAVGTPERPHLSGPKLLEAVRQHSLAADDVLLSAPWANTSALVGMATALAAELGREVRASVGLPVLGPAGPTSTFLAPDGSPTWEPVLLALTASPERGRVVSSAWRVLTGLEPLGPALYRAFDGWVVEAVPAGVWLRPEGIPRQAAARMLRPDPLRPLLLVGERERPVGEEVWSNLGTVLQALPDLGGTTRLGLLLHGTADADALAVGGFIARMHNLDWLDPELTSPAPTVPVPAPAPVPATAPVPASPAVPAASAVADPPAPLTAPTPRPAEDPAALLDVPPPPPTAARTVSSAVVDLPPPADPDPSISAPAAVFETPSATTALAPEAPAPASGAALLTPAAHLPAADLPSARLALKTLLGGDYHRLASRTDLIATRLPGLRSARQDDLRPDLVAVMVHHADGELPASRAELVTAARAATAGPLAPLLSCLGSGLRRLPSHHGAVLLGAPIEAALADLYVPGTVLTEPAAVAAVAARDVELETPVEFGIWSTTGRRTGIFGGPGDEPEVVFPPHTRFSVLAVLPGEPDVTPARVLLRELAATEGESPSEDRDRQVLARLQSWFERRDAVSPAERRRLPKPHRIHLTPGLAL